ncbi:MAG: GNAT family N-acetyltransferase [Methylophilaceae bacterium]|nr:GNAT family N-acetyltransferase [Methylophilaceae bacterium]
MWQPIISFRDALPADASQIAALINASYRGETSRKGWTTEANILDGLRTSEHEIYQLIQAEHSKIIVCIQNETLIGSIHLLHTDDSAHIGMFVVKPELQNFNIGKQLLTAAESFAQAQWQVKKLAMLVITVRKELIAFYERRGYKRTGLFQEFPVNPAVWQPKLKGLKLERLEKLVKLYLL